MTTVNRLPADALCSRCAPDQFSFNTTDDLEDLKEIIGQPRALEALRFGVGIRKEGYNLYVLGPPGIGKSTAVHRQLEQQAAAQSTPADWCYVNNFEQSHRPWALHLKAGQGVKLRDDMATLIDDMRNAIPLAFETEEFHIKSKEVEQEFEKRREELFSDLAEHAEKHGVTLLRTPRGFALAAVKDGEVISPEDFHKLPEQEQARIEQVVEVLQERLANIVRMIPQLQRDARDRIKTLARETARSVVTHFIDEVKKSYEGLDAVTRYLDAVQTDVINHVDEFRGEEETSVTGMHQEEPAFFRRYQVNVLVDHSGAEGAPIVYENTPSYQNLVGRVEHLSQLGTLVTDFTLIKPGALHRANGGYLILDAIKVLLQPFAWEGLKRAMNAHEIRIQSLAEAFSLISTVSLEPESIPMDVKVVLLGDRILYYMLYAYDPEFRELFKVAADFEEQLDRSHENDVVYARLIATLARKESLLRFDRGAVARLIEYSARMADDAEKLTTHMLSIVDLMREADYWAREAKIDTVTAEQVQCAIDKQISRSDRLRSRIYEAIQRGTVLIDTDGEKVGTVNGLSVIDLGNFAFAQPSRITATARLGEGEVLDIEREAELGGAIHSKGVMILSSYLAARYAGKQPLSLTASLVFEQSYGMVEGDSASMGELCALLSALAEAPVRQSLAITGSVNQLGQAQAIGGVNEKIEGFYDVCAARGLTGAQGVIIPATNVKHLMLRSDVVEAARQEQFHIYPVETVDQAIELLTGIEAGTANEQGEYPPGSINQRVAARLEELVSQREAFARASRGVSDSDAEGDHEDSG